MPINTVPFTINLDDVAKVADELMAAYAEAAVNEVTAARRDDDIVPTVFSTIVELEAANPEDFRKMRKVFMSDPSASITSVERETERASFCRYEILRRASDVNVMG